MNTMSVINNYIHGIHGKSKNISTDGENLYSNNLKIGYTYNGIKYVYYYVHEYKISDITSRHVSQALKCLGLELSDGIIPPDGFGIDNLRDEIREKRNRIW